MRKRLLAFLLSLCMIFSLLPVTAFAAGDPFNSWQFHIMDGKGFPQMKSLVAEANDIDPENNNIKIHGVYVYGKKSVNGTDARATGGIVESAIWKALGDFGSSANGKADQYNGWTVINTADVILEDSVTSISIYAKDGDRQLDPVRVYLAENSLKHFYNGTAFTEISLKGASLVPFDDSQEGDIGNAVYHYIVVEMDDRTRADFDALPGELSKQIRIYSTKYPVVGFRAFGPKADGSWSTSNAIGVTANSITQIALTRDNAATPSNIIPISPTNDPTYDVTFSEATHNGLSALRIYISKKVPVATDKTVTINYVDEDTDKTVGTQVLTLKADTTIISTGLFTEVPETYVLVETGDVYIGNKTEIEVLVRQAAMTMNIRFVLADGTFIAGGDYFLPEGVQNLSILEPYVPEGYQMAESGDFMVTAGGSRDVIVEKIDDDVIMKIRFVLRDGTFISGGDYFLPEGVQNLSILEPYVPEGYQMAESGDFMVTAGGSRDVIVEKISKDVIMKIRFVLADGTFIAGGDYFLPEGIQNFSILDQYVPEGYKRVEFGDFFVTDGGSEDVTVEKASKDVIMNIRFVLADGTFIAGGDYFLPEGIQNFSILDPYVPEGYKRVEFGDFFVTDGGSEDVTIEKIDDDTKTYTLTYDANYSGGRDEDYDYEAGETAIIKGDLFGRKNYTFTGWNTRANGNGTDYEEGERLTLTGDLTLYAQWRKNGSTGTDTTSYTIDASASRGGDISPSGRVFVARGNDRTFRITADEGYVIDDVRVDGESVGAVHTYTFENVRRDHTIEVIFVPDGQQTVAYGPDDTGVSDWLNVDDHVSYLNGYPGGLFGPNDNMTRAEVAQMFYNLLLNQNVTVTVSFADVSADAWYAQAVNALASLGIVQGVGDGMFAPERTITRAEFTVIAMRFAELPTGGTNPFSDVRTSDWFYAQVVGAAQYGWITGYTNGTFGPNNTITRAEVTAIVNRMLSRSADEDFVDDNAAELVRFNDVSDTYWAYYDIMEATNSHEYEWDNNAEEWTDLA